MDGPPSKPTASKNRGARKKPQAQAAGYSLERPARLLLVCRRAGSSTELRNVLAKRWDVECVTSGAAALEIARSRPLDLMICELELPGPSGLQVLRRLRNDAQTRCLPFILAAPSARHSSCIKALELGADDYIHRPFAVREVLARVEMRLACGKFLAAERVARTEAEQANRAKSEFLAFLSHEMRNPLSAMVEWVSMLRAVRKSPAEGTRVLELLAFSLGMQQRLLDDLGDFSQIASGCLVLKQRPIPCLSAVVTAVLDLFRPIAAKKQIVLRTSIVPIAGPLHADAERLQQVIWNLLSNAVKFTPATGRVDVTCRRVGQFVELKVSDTGAGITPGAMLHLFKRFWRGGLSSEGLGIGLSVVEGIVRLHGGTVHAHSAGANRGAVFTVRLPIAAAPVLRELAARSAVRHRMTVPRMHILLVEDQLETAKAIQRVLINKGHSVRHETTVAGAVRAAAACVFDLLICDLSLSDGTGFELLPRIREFLPHSVHATGKVPAIVLSGYVDDASVARSLAAGFASHLEKPVDSSVLLTAIREVAEPFLTSQARGVARDT
jgi:signal transduction histidine kinase